MTTTASTGKVDFVKSLGADNVIDYKTQKFEELPDKYDVVLDTVGKSPNISSLYRSICSCHLSSTNFLLLEESCHYAKGLRPLYSSRPTMIYSVLFLSKSFELYSNLSLLPLTR